MTAEGKRLAEARRGLEHWKHWGPYLAERAWGTVRRTTARWRRLGSFPHDHARSRAYRWNEDGLPGIATTSSDCAWRSRSGTDATPS